VVIAVGEDHFDDLDQIAGGMSVKLRCDRDALDIWWNASPLASRSPDRSASDGLQDSQAIRAPAKDGSSFSGKSTAALVVRR